MGGKAVDGCYSSGSRAKSAFSRHLQNKAAWHVFIAMVLKKMEFLRDPDTGLLTSNTVLHTKIKLDSVSI